MCFAGTNGDCSSWKASGWVGWLARIGAFVRSKFARWACGDMWAASHVATRRSIRNVRFALCKQEAFLVDRRGEVSVRVHPLGYRQAAIGLCCVR